MAVIAQIKFTQNAVEGEPTTAYVGVVNSLVTVENDLDELSGDDFASWSVEIIGCPRDSSFFGGLPVEIGSADTDTVSATFLPDVTGSYRIRSTVWALAGEQGSKSVDIRNFVIPEPKHGFISPPYQQDPAPLPTVASGALTAKPNELNIDGEELGWMGTGSDGLLATVIKDLDASNFDLLPDPTLGGQEVVTAGNIPDFNVPVSSVEHGDSVWYLNLGLASQAGDASAEAPRGGITRVSKLTGKILERLILQPSLGFVGVIPMVVVSTGTKLYVLGVQITTGSVSGRLTAYDISVSEAYASSVAATGHFGTSTELYADIMQPVSALYDATNNRVWFTARESSYGSHLLAFSPPTLTGFVDQFDAPNIFMTSLMLDPVQGHYGGSGGPRLVVAAVDTAGLANLIVALGSLGTGVTPETSTTIGLPYTGLPFWADMGGGTASPGEGRVYVTDPFGTGNVIAYELDGTQLWSIPAVFGTAITYESSTDRLLIRAFDAGTTSNLLGAFSAVDGTPVGTPTQLRWRNEANAIDFVSPRFAVAPFVTALARRWYTSAPGAAEVANSGADPAGHAVIADLTALPVAEPRTAITGAFTGPSRLLWRLDGTGDVETWAEVYAVILARRGPVTICMDQPGIYVISSPPAGPIVAYQMNNARFEALDRKSSAGLVSVVISNFAVLVNLAGIAGAMELTHTHLVADGVGAPLLFVNRPFGVPQYPMFVVDRDAAINSGALADLPLLTVPAPPAMQSFHLVFSNGGTALAGGLSDTVYVDTGATLNIVVLNGGLGYGAVQAAGWLGSAGGATAVNWVHDGTLVFPTASSLLSNAYHVGNTGPNVNKPLGLIGGSSDVAPVTPSEGTLWYDRANDHYFHRAGGGVGSWRRVGGMTAVTIAASTTQTQGNGAFTTDIADVTPVANANDTVTLWSTKVGDEIIVMNNGANTLRVYPAVGQNLGAGLNAFTTQAAGVTNRYVCYTSTLLKKL